MGEEIYEAPTIIVYGSLLEQTKGSGGNETDGCSSGKYEADGGDE